MSHKELHRELHRCTKFTEKRRWRSQNFNPEEMIAHPPVNEIPFHPHKKGEGKKEKNDS